MNRSVLRTYVIGRSGGVCEWPGCGDRGAELAHLHSIGMGGRKSADEPCNVAWFCRDHARISDGEYGSGGWPQYEREHRLLGVVVGDYLAYERAEALRQALIDRYGPGC